MPRPCGNPQCSVSTGIHDALTFGSGKLDNNGFWEFPCEICELDYLSSKMTLTEFERSYDRWSKELSRFMKMSQSEKDQHNFACRLHSAAIKKNPDWNPARRTIPFRVSLFELASAKKKG